MSISLLSTKSKTLEVMYKRLHSLMNKHHLLYGSRDGFRSNHSTVDAITEFVIKILPSLDKQEISLSAYLDLINAFDTINHNVMLKNIQLNTWKRLGYLSRRGQYVCYKGVSSEAQSVDNVVPQGYVLGPLICIIYTNDIPNSITHGTTIMFADDITVYDHMNVASTGPINY